MVNSRESSLNDAEALFVMLFTDGSIGGWESFVHPNGRKTGQSPQSVRNGLLDPETRPTGRLVTKLQGR